MFGMTQKRPLRGLRQRSRGPATLNVARPTITGKNGRYWSQARPGRESSRFRHPYGTDPRELRR